MRYDVTLVGPVPSSASVWPQSGLRHTSSILQAYFSHTSGIRQAYVRHTSGTLQAYVRHTSKKGIPQSGFSLTSVWLQSDLSVASV